MKKKRNPKKFIKFKKFIPVRQIGKPDDVAKLCLFLASITIHQWKQHN